MQTVLGLILSKRIVVKEVRKMQKEKFEMPIVEVITFEVADIITASGNNLGEWD